ncbi:MAG: hypothetical protein J5855_01375 [Mailhella sp.]|nr:hypothetical protein [Mailhella sp.]
MPPYRVRNDAEPAAAFDSAMRLKRAPGLRRGDERFFGTDEDDELFSTPKKMV